VTTSNGVALPMADCWNVIGVKGDRSCKQLESVQHCNACSVFARAAQAFLDRPAPDAYVAEMTALLSESAAARVEADQLSVVLFDIGDQILALDTRAVVEVTEPRRVHRIGHRSGNVFSGIVNIHGQLELCASLRGLLQISAAPEHTPAMGARMLLVEHDGERWVFAADGVRGVHRFESRAVSEVPATAKHDGTFYVKSVLSWQDRRVGYLDLERTFSALEQSLR
jgi:chemotaxis-related protein WspD